MVGKVVRGGMQQSNGYGKAQDLPNGSLRQEKSCYIISQKHHSDIT